MAHTLSAKKRIRQSLSRRLRNKVAKSQVKSHVKRVLESVTGQKATEAQTALNKAYQMLDKAGAKRVIHWKTAARKKSRLARKVAAIGAAPKATPANA